MYNNYMKIYLVRHGETDWVGKKFQGQTIEVPLNAHGIHQAQQTAKQLQPYNFDACFCSPAWRAQQTAEIICKLHPGLIIQTEPLIIERCFGKLEGQSSSPEEFHYEDYWNYDKNLADRGIESLHDLLARADQFINKIKTTFTDDAELLVVAHGSLNKALYYSCQGYNATTDFLNYHQQTGEYTILEI